MVSLRVACQPLTLPSCTSLLLAVALFFCSVATAEISPSGSLPWYPQWCPLDNATASSDSAPSSCAPASVTDSAGMTLVPYTLGSFTKLATASVKSLKKTLDSSVAIACEVDVLATPNGDQADVSVSTNVYNAQLADAKATMNQALSEGCDWIAIANASCRATWCETDSGAKTQYTFVQAALSSTSATVGVVNAGSLASKYYSYTDFVVAINCVSRGTCASFKTYADAGQVVYQLESSCAAASFSIVPKSNRFWWWYRSYITVVAGSDGAWTWCDDATPAPPTTSAPPSTLAPPSTPVPIAVPRATLRTSTASLNEQKSVEGEAPRTPAPPTPAPPTPKPPTPVPLTTSQPTTTAVPPTSATTTTSSPATTIPSVDTTVLPTPTTTAVPDVVAVPEALLPPWWWWTTTRGPTTPSPTTSAPTTPSPPPPPTSTTTPPTTLAPTTTTAVTATTTTATTVATSAATIAVPPTTVTSTEAPVVAATTTAVPPSNPPTTTAVTSDATSAPTTTPSPPQTDAVQETMTEASSASLTTTSAPQTDTPPSTNTPSTDTPSTTTTTTTVETAPSTASATTRAPIATETPTTVISTATTSVTPSTSAAGTTSAAPATTPAGTITTEAPETTTSVSTLATSTTTNAPTPSPGTTTISAVTLRLSGNSWSAALALSSQQVVRSVIVDLARTLSIDPTTITVVSLSVGSLIAAVSIRNAPANTADVVSSSPNAFSSTAGVYSSYSSGPDDSVSVLSVVSKPVTVSNSPPREAVCTTLCIGLLAGVGTVLLSAIVIIGAVALCRSGPTLKRQPPKSVFGFDGTEEMEKGGADDDDDDVTVPAPLQFDTFPRAPPALKSASATPSTSPATAGLRAVRLVVVTADGETTIVSPHEQVPMSPIDGCTPTATNINPLRPPLRAHKPHRSASSRAANAILVQRAEAEAKTQQREKDLGVFTAGDGGDDPRVAVPMDFNGGDDDDSYEEDFPRPPCAVPM